MALSTLALFVLLVGGGWFWYDTLAALERANAVAAATCKNQGVQLLHDTVVFQKLRIVRGADNNLAIERIYLFEYTAPSLAYRRQSGFIVMRGRRVTSVGLAPEN